ncbi:hypothetical protein BT96DRAFT_838012 [Gymnopus androsaceus JB14]|uniref:Uncharacterized protein n=1 Tax=Gymnopus androsaceus JB14 TaxID=1447944 RepID=A0A6A4GPC9_9AGAR|nr:hypothetical protein BT96DRAFT_838012 [Gymnopus androsaceus JB14]
MVEAEPTDEGRSRIPDLIVRGPGRVEQVINTNKGKLEVFQKAFFPPPPPVSKVPADVVYPPAAWTFTPATNLQFMSTIQRTKNGKATQLGTMPNNLLKATSHLLVPHLGPIYHAMLSQKVYPDNWALTERIILRKPGKADYHVPGSWRNIVTSSRHGQVTNSTMSEKFTKMVEILLLLPEMQFRAQPG